MVNEKNKKISAEDIKRNLRRYMSLRVYIVYLLSVLLWAIYSHNFEIGLLFGVSLAMALILHDKYKRKLAE